MTAKRALLVFLLMLVLLSAFSGCIAPPKGNPAQATSSSSGTSGGSKGGPVTTTPTTIPAVTGFVTQATPYPVPTTQRLPTKYTVLPNIKVNMTEYTAIYYNTLAFRQNKTAFSYNLTMPSMIIQMCFKPNMTTQTIWYQSRYGTKDNVTQKVSYIGPSVWFEVTVRDPATGDVLAKDGYSRTYSTDPAKSVTIRSQGTYLIEFAGNDLSAEIQILVPNTTEQRGVMPRNLSCGGPLLQ